MARFVAQKLRSYSVRYLYLKYLLTLSGVPSGNLTSSAFEPLTPADHKVLVVRYFCKVSSGVCDATSLRLSSPQTEYFSELSGTALCQHLDSLLIRHSPACPFAVITLVVHCSSSLISESPFKLELLKDSIVLRHLLIAVSPM